MLYGDDGSPLHYSNVFLPAIYQGTRLGDARTPVKESKIGYLGDPSLPPELQRQHLDLIQARNRLDQEAIRRGSQYRRPHPILRAGFPHADGRRRKFSTVMKESKATLDLYGSVTKETDNFGRKCLMARRLAEAGVRYIQVTDNGWDHHAKISS